MTPTDGFKKSVTPKAMSVREAVAQYGDFWRAHAGQGYVGASELVTFDGREKVSMWLMERGISPRIPASDL